MCDNQIFCWNCHGAKSDKVLREFKEFKRTNMPVLVILLEPMISEANANEVFKKFGKTRRICSEADSFSGGIWVVWDDKEIKIKTEVCHFFHSCNDGVYR